MIVSHFLFHQQVKSELCWSGEAHAFSEFCQEYCLIRKKHTHDLTSSFYFDITKVVNLLFNLPMVNRYDNENKPLTGRLFSLLFIYFC